MSADQQTALMAILLFTLVGLVAIVVAMSRVSQRTARQEPPADPPATDFPETTLLDQDAQPW